jgi:hypothetical protein
MTPVHFLSANIPAGGTPSRCAFFTRKRRDKSLARNALNSRTAPTHGRTA